ncbi:MAG: PSD1 and planctomycete cytochrome C domain-containing protein [Opitutales bacterium]|nr:PSD1 and planctomycete cytochrome C domain-containing protein [Opitutales bacterium]
MKKTLLPITFFTLLTGNLLAEEKVDFSREVLPVLSNKCFVCHGPDTKKKDLVRLDSFEGATRDLDGYKAINPDKPEDSEILVRIHDPKDPMPPKKAEKKLTAGERDILTRWAKQGGTYATHWAFVSPVKTKTEGKGNPIDFFIGQKLKAKEIEPAPEAKRSTLARRAALILTGFPPDPKQLKAYMDDKRPDAYERLVDELLGSSSFGEHQARYWLDAIRYGDTHGLHLDNRRGIYPYRDWVVRSLNENLPLDQFIIWQLAGDLLPEPTLAQQIATGFVRMNPSTAEGGAIPEEFQAKNNFDRVETLGTALLGMSLICARCHTHKYDPIPQTEYYRLMAFFNNTAESSMDGNKYEYTPNIKAPPDQDSWNEWNVIKGKRAVVLKDAVKIQADAYNRWEKASEKERFKLLTNPDPKVIELQKRATGVAKSLADSEKRFTTTLVAKELPKPRVTRLLERGEYNLPVGEPLQPGIPKVMGSFPKDAPRNRLGLARWLTAREHPLVARVLINRIWQRTFGEGLVRTPADFGLQGEQPTHPELLDWLAVDLQDHKWNLKKMMRLMVTSRTFRQSSTRSHKLTDPENRLWARGPSYRLDAEVLRDIGLWASQLLDPTMGGEGVKPYQPAGLWKALMHPGSNTKNYVTDKGERQYRRSLYVYWKRTSPHPMMTLFDAPSRETSCVRRSRTTTPTQSLALLNERQRVEMGRMLGQRLLKEGKDNANSMRLLFTLLVSRDPEPAENEACMKLFQQLQKRYKENPKDAEAFLSIGGSARDKELDAANHAAWSQVALTVLASDIALWVY